MNSPVICQSVQSQMADFSAGQLAPVEANAFEEHCAKCAICQREWETFQGTLLLLSELCQPFPCEDASEEMWGVCSADWMMRVEMHRTKMPLWGAIRGWAMQQPRWGWVAISGAVTVFVGVWLMSPSNAPSEAVNFAAVTSEIPADGGPLRIFDQSPTVVTQSGLGIFPSSSNARRVEFSVPSAMASSAVDYHTQSSFAPFVDHVGSGLVSSSSPLVVKQPANQVPASPIPAPSMEQPLNSQSLPTKQSTMSPPVSALLSPTPTSAMPVATPTFEASVSEPR